jgi:hypothetical protein
MTNPKDKMCLATDEAVELWLHEKAGPAYDELKADPSRTVSIDDVRAKLAALRAAVREGLHSGPAEPMDMEAIITHARAGRPTAGK